jgi:hypothetical protein
VLNLSGSGWGPVAGSLEHGNEHLGSIKGREFLDYLSLLLASEDGLYSMVKLSYLLDNSTFPSVKFYQML